MKILITGAYGQLGNELKVLSKNYPNWEFVYTDVDSLDITDEEQVKSYFADNNFELVINCAAYTAVDMAESDFETAQKVNALAPRLLAKYSKAVGAKLIHVSTDYVFAGDAHLPYEETDAVAPN